MADYFTSFSCLFDVGSAINAVRARTILTQLGEKLDAEEDGAALGFTIQSDEGSGPGMLCLYSEEDGEPEHVIAFVKLCAEAFALTGRWGFHWALTCSRPRPAGFGGGAHVLDLATGETIDWMDCEHWLVTQVTAASAVPTGSAIMIRRFLDCSSGHLSPETWSWLDTNLAEEVLREPANRTTASLAGGRTRYGWFVYAPEDPDDAMPEDLSQVCCQARKQGAEYVLLDCDAMPLEDLPVLHPDFAAG